MTKVEELGRAISYPSAVPRGAMSFAFVVDGREIAAHETDGRLVVSCVLAGAARTESAPRLLDLAAGRMTKDAAVLAWDPEREAVVLWERAGEVKVKGEGEQWNLKNFFEEFLASVDWWMDRVEESGSGLGRLSEMVIRP